MANQLGNLSIEQIIEIAESGQAAHCTHTLQYKETDFDEGKQELIERPASVEFEVSIGVVDDNEIVPMTSARVAAMFFDRIEQAKAVARYSHLTGRRVKFRNSETIGSCTALRYDDEGVLACVDWDSGESTRLAFASALEVVA